MTLPNEIRNALSRLHPCPHLQECEADWREKARRSFPGNDVEPLWQKARGRVPCGFSGASDGPAHVKAVFVIAEPSPPKGQPLRDVPDEALLEKVYQQSTENLRVGWEHHHKNLKDGVLRRFFPNASFDELMRHCFITCSVYCCNPNPFDASAHPPTAVEERCGRVHLIELLKLFPHAEIIALGGKADSRLGKLAIEVPDAPGNIRDRIVAKHPVARPKNHPEESWRNAARTFAERQGRQHASRTEATTSEERNEFLPSSNVTVRPGQVAALRRDAQASGDWPPSAPPTQLASAVVTDPIARTWCSKTFSIAPGVTFDEINGFRCPTARGKTRDGWIEREDRRRPRPPYHKLLVAIAALGGTASGFAIVEMLKDEPRESKLSAHRYWSEYLRDGTGRYGPYFLAE